MSAVSTLVRNGVAGWRRFPPNLFAIPFGLAGLAEAWRAAGQTLHTPEAIPDLIDVLAALAWIALLFCYAAQGARTGLADLRHKTFSPFISLAPVTGMLLAVALSAHAFAAGQALVVVFLVVTLLIGGFLTGEWITADLDHDSAHPGYFLPTVAGGLVGAFCASQVHLHGVRRGIVRRGHAVLAARRVDDPEPAVLPQSPAARARPNARHRARAARGRRDRLFLTDRRQDRLDRARWRGTRCSWSLSRSACCQPSSSSGSARAFGPSRSPGRQLRPTRCSGSRWAGRQERPATPS